jgi:MFS superfamily sulfate permease-like transporter
MTKKNQLHNLKSDFASGLVVFFGGLPLCLGIAMASGAPYFQELFLELLGNCS